MANWVKNKSRRSRSSLNITCDDFKQDCATSDAIDISTEICIDGEMKNIKDITRMDAKREMVIGRWYQKGIMGHHGLFANYFSLTATTQQLVVRTWALELFEDLDSADRDIYLSVKGPVMDKTRFSKYECNEFYVIWMSINQLIGIAKNVILSLPKQYNLRKNNCRHFVDKMLENVAKQHSKIDINAQQITQYVKVFGSAEPTVKVEKKKEEESSFDIESGGKSISIAQALKEYPIGCDVAKKKRSKNSDDCIVM